MQYSLRLLFLTLVELLEKLWDLLIDRGEPCGAELDQAGRLLDKLGQFVHLYVARLEEPHDLLNTCDGLLVSLLWLLRLGVASVSHKDMYLIISIFVSCSISLGYLIALQK